MKNVVIQLEI